MLIFRNGTLIPKSEINLPTLAHFKSIQMGTIRLLELENIKRLLKKLLQSTEKLPRHYLTACRNGSPILPY